MSDLTEQARRVLELHEKVTSSYYSQESPERLALKAYGQDLLPLFAKEYLEHIHNEEEFHLTREGIKLTEERDQLRAEVERLKEANRLGALYAIKEKDKLESDLQAARKAMELGVEGLKSLSWLRSSHAHLWNNAATRGLAALNAELEKK